MQASGESEAYPFFSTALPGSRVVCKTPSFVPEASRPSVPPRNGLVPELLRGILPITQLLVQSLCLSPLLTLSPLCLGTALRVLTRNLALACTRPLASALCEDPGTSVIFRLPQPTLPHR